MRTFLDENRIYGSTFLLYGNINDDFYGPDASVQKLEQYLVSLLKSRGYDHILFYGTRGVYCRDGASARFFFKENENLPAMGAGAGSYDIQEEDDDDDVDSMVTRGRVQRGTAEPEYEAGSLSDEPLTEAGTEPAPQLSGRIRYKLTDMIAAEFYPSVRDKMLDPRSRLVIVFYDILTDFGARDSVFLPILKDDILSGFSQSGDHNLCLIIAPDTMQNTCDLQGLLRNNGLGSKFLNPQGNSFIFNSDCCFQMGYPAVDEIRNMLHRFAVVGTSRHKRIRFSYNNLQKLAERILANASVDAQRRGNPLLRKMRSIAYTLEAYIHQKARGRHRVEITQDVIDEIWGVHIEADEALKKLNRRGWEKAYNGVCQAIRSSKNAVRNLTVDPESQTHVPDLGLERLALNPAMEGGPRPPIPNFVLLGRPGTGKTQIARLIGKILYAEGILKIGHSVEVTREQLTSSYIGGVPKATIAQVDQAEEGVLFIDEAHSLGRKDGGEHHEGTGVEVVSTLNAAITDPSRHFCTILAGYPDQMEAVFDLDPGFRRRFQVVIDLDDYDPELLYEILLGMIRDAQYQVDPELTQEQTSDDGQTYVPLKAMVERIYAERDRENFGNAGDMETLVTYATGLTEDDILRRECFYGGLGKITEEFFVPMDLGMTKEKILAEMEERFVGMKSVKEMLEDKGFAIERALFEGKQPGDIPLEPIILVGNPGAGKTVAAGQLAKLFYSYGMLGTPEIIEYSASDLVSEYQNDTREVRRAIKKAQDRKGFLFVDEAHNLDEKTLKAFLNPLTNPKKPFVACFAVYTDELEKFLALDRGSRSRFEKGIIHIDDYTPEELYEIFVRAMEREGYTASEEALSLVKQLMVRKYQTRTTDTGNARNALNILAEMRTALDRRCIREKIPFDDPRSRLLVADDIPEDYRKGLSAGDNASRLAQLQELEQQIDTHRVGNAELKEIMHKLLRKFRFQLRFPDRSTDIIEPGHYFFKGNAGTGKSTSLSFLGEFLFRMGIIQDPTPVQLSASRLVGQYLGQTAVQTRQLLEQNMGRLILIDEAYALADANERANSYKQDAINELVAKLDDEAFRKTTCVVFAGYPGDMDALYAANQGLKSRVKEVSFPDFTHEECIRILVDMLEGKKAPIREDALARCDQQIAFLRAQPDFANGRTIRDYVNILTANRENRMLGASDEETLAPDFFQVQPCDLPETQALPRLLNL